MRLHRIAAIGILAGVSLTAQAADAPLQLVADIPLPGPPIRFDYQSLDPTTHLLFASHMGAGTLLVFDTQTRTVKADLAGFPQVTGVLAVPEHGRVYASASAGRVGGEAMVSIVDTATLKTTAQLAGGRFPDGIAYATDRDKVYVSDETGRVVLVYDAATEKRLGQIDVGGMVGNTRYDPVAKRILSAIQSRGDLVVIDPAADTVESRIPLPGGQYPHGLLLVPQDRIAFVACQRDAKLLTVDLERRSVIAIDPIGAGPDVLSFDAGLGRLYVAAESGPLAVFDYHNRKLTKLADMDVGPRAHTVEVNSETHEVYLPIENWQGRPILRIMAPAAAR